MRSARGTRLVPNLRAARLAGPAVSVLASSWVWEHSESKGTARLVLLALADHAGSDGGDAYPSVTRLALRCGVSKRTVQEALKVLVSLGELVIDKQAGPHGANRYQIAMTPADSAPVQNLRPAASAPDPRRSRTTPLQNPHAPPADPAPEPSLTVIEPSGNRPSRASTAQTEFDLWWEHYPLKVSKGAARKAFPRARRKAPIDVLIAGAVAYAEDPSRKPDFTKHPATWLNDECWNDDRTPTRTESNGTRAGKGLLRRSSETPLQELSR